MKKQTKRSPIVLPEPQEMSKDELYQRWRYERWKAKKLLEVIQEESSRGAVAMAEGCRHRKKYPSLDQLDQWHR